MFHMCTLGECFVWMEQMLGESVELSELGNVLCGSELVLGECFTGEDDTHSGLTRLHVCLLSCEICDCLPSVIKCYQVLPSVAKCCHGVAMVIHCLHYPSSVPCTQVKLLVMGLWAAGCWLRSNQSDCCIYPWTITFSPIPFVSLNVLLNLTDWWLFLLTLVYANTHQNVDRNVTHGYCCT